MQNFHTILQFDLALLDARKDSAMRTTRQGENEVQSRGARDRRALTGEAGNASRRKVIVGDAGMNPIRDGARRTQDGRGLIIVA